MNPTLKNQLANVEFKITFAETNLRYFFDCEDSPENQEKINNSRKQIREAKDELLKLIEDNGLNKSLWAGFHLDK